MGIVVNELLTKSKDRRNFIKNLGLASAAAGVVASVASVPLEAQSAALTDVDILNFALNLEYLEAEFYSVATSGLTIDKFEVATTGSGTAGATTGGNKVFFVSSAVFDLALELCIDERTHVSLLRSAITALGGTPVAKPAINLGAAGLGFANQNDFLRLARIFEEIGVSAYGGAAAAISSKSILTYAARILAAEAEHVGYIRSLLIQNNILVGAIDPADIVPANSNANGYFTSKYFSLDGNALSAIRTPAQVLFLAYGNNSNSAGGGFFPNGVNASNSALTVSSAMPAVTDSATFSLNPNPIFTNGVGSGSTTLSWSAPAGVTQVSIRLGSPAGAYFIYGGPSGSMTTPNWVSDGLVFYLQDASNLTTEQTAAKTLAIAVAHVF